MSTQYRMLEPGEVIQEGDEWLDGRTWKSCRSIGMTVLTHNPNFRRPIAATNESSISQSDITVEQAMKDLLRASENQDESIDNGPSVIRKFLSIGAEFENWPECYQKLAWEISRIQSDRESLQSRIAELEGALRPFAFVPMRWEGEDIVISFTGKDRKEYTVRARHLIEAAAVLGWGEGK